MAVLVAMHHIQDEQAITELLEQWSGCVRLIYATNEHCIGEALGRQQFRLVIVLTEGKALPGSWSTLLKEQPVIILSGSMEFNLITLTSLLSTYEGWSTSDNTKTLFRSTLDYIDDNLCDEELSLEKVASTMFVSKYHYSRLFQKHLGIGFKAYVIKKRIQKAKLMLQRGHQVTDVCYSIGYGDLTHFSRVFKRLVGVNPSIYRMRHDKISTIG